MFKHIFFATDGSPASEHAASIAVGLARSCGAKLTAAYVVDPYPYLGIGEATPMGMQAYMAAARDHAAAAHAKVAKLAEGVQLQTLLIEDVAAARGILKGAADNLCDLIVVGSHGRTAIGKFVLGSVSSKVVSMSEIPVLVAR